MSSMPHSTPQVTPPDPTEVVLGVDTHKDVHVAAVLTTLGFLLATGTFPTTAAGYLGCWHGHAGSARLAAPVWSAPAPTAPRWRVTCTPRRSR